MVVGKGDNGLYLFSNVYVCFGLIVDICFEFMLLFVFFLMLLFVVLVLVLDNNVICMVVVWFVEICVGIIVGCG